MDRYDYDDYLDDQYQGQQDLEREEWLWENQQKEEWKNGRSAKKQTN